MSTPGFNFVVQCLLALGEVSETKAQVWFWGHLQMLIQVQAVWLGKLLTLSGVCDFACSKCYILQLQGFLSSPLVIGLESNGFHCTGSI